MLGSAYVSKCNGGVPVDDGRSAIELHSTEFQLAACSVPYASNGINSSSESQDPRVDAAGTCTDNYAIRNASARGHTAVVMRLTDGIQCPRVLSSVFELTTAGGVSVDPKKVAASLREAAQRCRSHLAAAVVRRRRAATSHRGSAESHADVDRTALFR